LHAPWHSKGAGNLLELKLGGRVVTSAEDVLQELSIANLHAVSFTSHAEPCSEHTEALSEQQPLEQLRLL
jgi:hypothetical protein